MTFSLISRDTVPTLAGDRRHWQNLRGATSGLAIADAARTLGRFVFVIAPDSQTASRLEREVRFFLGDREDTPVLLFPDWETLPYDVFSAHQDIVSARLSTLAQLPSLQAGVLITPAATLMHRLPPQEYIGLNSLALDKGDQLKMDVLRRELDACGYRSTGSVYEHGEYAIRGSIIDLFPMGSEDPYRIDLFDNEVDTLRTFDPDTQRTISEVDAIRLLPARETPMTDGAISRFRQAFREKFDVAANRCPVYRDVSDGIAPPGIEYYLPLFYEHTSTLFDYLPDTALAMTVEGLQDSMQRFWAGAEERWEDRRVDPDRPLLPPAELFLRPDDVFARLKELPLVQLERGAGEAGAGRYSFGCDQPPELQINEKPVTRWPIWRSS